MGAALDGIKVVDLSRTLAGPFCAMMLGRTGPMAHKPGYDLIIQAYSGIMSTTGEADGPPVRTGFSMVDLFTGMMAYGSILTALMAREKTGKGQFVEASLLEGQIATMSYHAVGYLASGLVPGRMGSAHPALCPYQAFPSSDGFFILGCANDGLWRRLCPAIGLEHLTEDPRFETNTDRAQNRGELIPLSPERALQDADFRGMATDCHGRGSALWAHNLGGGCGQRSPAGGT